MSCTPELRIMKRLKRADISRRDLANILSKNYSTIVSWLNGYTKLPDEYRDKINQLIDNRLLEDVE